MNTVKPGILLIIGTNSESIMNIVMVDSANLSGDTDFPDLNLPKYGWMQFLSLDEAELAERCWRADVIISTRTPIRAELIEGAFKLKLIIAAGEDVGHIDQGAAQTRGITLCNVPGLTGDNPQNTRQICCEVVNIINAWLEEKPINLI